MKDLESVLKRFSGKKVIVAGDVMLDKFTWGIEISRNPENPDAPKFED